MDVAARRLAARAAATRRHSRRNGRRHASPARDAPAVAEALRRAALAADADPCGNVQRHLWANLDPSMLQRSPPAKAFVQDFYTAMMMLGPVLGHGLSKATFPCLSDRLPIFEDEACLRKERQLTPDFAIESSGTLRVRWYGHLRYAAELMALIFCGRVRRLGPRPRPGDARSRNRPGDRPPGGAARRLVPV